MKISKFVFLMAITAVGLISCRKDEAAKKNIAGIWEGAWGFGIDVPSFYEKWDLDSDGQLKAFFPSGEVYATGTWELDGDDFEAVYSPIWESYTYRFTGKYDEDDDEITGDWLDMVTAVDGGTFEMSKQ